MTANATGTVAALPGLVAAIKAYHADLRAIERLCILVSIVSLIGGVIGAVLVLWISGAMLRQLVPYLLLFATLLFTFSDWLLRKLPALPQAGWASLHKAALMQFVVAVYGGFYGLGISFLLLALFRMLGLDQIHQINGLKVLSMSCISIVATLTFVWAGVVDWYQTGLLTLGMTIGGYMGAYYARLMQPQVIKYLIIITGFGMTIYFFCVQQP